MVKTIRARFSRGVIKPLEKVDIPKGKEVTIIIAEAPTKELISEEKRRDKQWSSLAISGFVNDWENEKDAIYDKWEYHYHVQKRCCSFNSFPFC